MIAIVKTNDSEIEITDLSELGRVTGSLDEAQTDYSIEFRKN
jgi:hypothetical protein